MFIVRGQVRRPVQGAGVVRGDRLRVFVRGDQDGEEIVEDLAAAGCEPTGRRGD